MTKSGSGGTQTNHVYQTIRAGLLSAALKPGQKLRISEIAEQEQVSLGAVREALAKLAAEEMTVATAQKGYSVPGVSAPDLVSLTQTRVILEGEALAASIKAMDVETESALVGALHRLERIPERLTNGEERINSDWASAHETFHEALVASCTNVWLLKLRRTLYHHSERYRALSVPLRQEKRDVKAEHRAIFDAVMASDVETAKKMMSDHIWRTTNIILETNAFDA